MPAVLDQAKSAAYTGVGMNLLVTDAIVGREVPTPKFVGDHASIARNKATEALTGFRGRTEPRAIELADKLPEPIADAVTTGRTAVWDFIGIDAPKAAKKAAASKSGATKAAKKAPAEAAKAEA